MKIFSCFSRTVSGEKMLKKAEILVNITKATCFQVVFFVYGIRRNCL